MELSKVPGIYAVLSEDRVAYVGSSVNTVRRSRQHLSTLQKGTHRNFLLQRVFDKHGELGLTFTLVEECSKEALVEREQHYIDTLKPWCNLSDAKGAHSHTDEARSKMREYALNRTPEHADAITAANKSRRGVPNGRAGVPTGRVPRTAFKTGATPWNKKYSPEELAEKRKEWNRLNGARYRETHTKELREYKKLKAREYRARKKELN